MEIWLFFLCVLLLLDGFFFIIRALVRSEVVVIVFVCLFVCERIVERMC